MRLVFGIVTTATLSLLLGIAARVYAQQEQQDKKKGHPEQQKHEQAKPNPQHAQQQQSDHK